ncbi:unnamed protein product, partial [Larinioides sclopetarius]
MYEDLEERNDKNSDILYWADANGIGIITEDEVIMILSQTTFKS